jgi:hypothetical protein
MCLFSCTSTANTDDDVMCSLTGREPCSNCERSRSCIQRWCRSGNQ